MTDRQSEQQQRELLELEAKTVRLKLLIAAQMQNQQPNTASPDYLHGLRLLLEGIPLSGLAVKAFTHPKRWHNKILLSAAVAGLAWFNKRRH